MIIEHNMLYQSMMNKILRLLKEKKQTILHLFSVLL